MINPRQDVFGYYRVGNFYSYSKFEASLEHKRTGKKLEWIYNDDIYSQQNWLVEPAETLDELYRQRAQALRDQYDYLVLWYSGGSDSQNILDTFLDNDIKLDELASYETSQFSGQRDDECNAEIFHVAIPGAKRAQHKQPGMRHTVIDQTVFALNHFELPDTKFNWIYHANTAVHPQTFTRLLYIYQSQSHWQRLFDSGKKVAFIFGTDKPNVKGFGRDWVFHFHDWMDGVQPAVAQILDRPWNFPEPFYWSPNSPKIVIKQAHIVKRYLETLTIQSPDVHVSRSENLANCCVTTSNGRILFVPMRQLNSLLYSKWQWVPYQVKPKSLIFSIQSSWFFKQSQEEIAMKHWKIGLEHRWHQTPDSLKVDPANLSKGFKAIHSKYYRISS